MLQRRQFLTSVSLGLGSLALLPTSYGFEVKRPVADIVILGAGVGGVAAALSALRLGKRVIMTEETDWIGGQYTSQAVPPDENRWVEETFGCTRTHRQFRAGVRQYYREHYPMTDAARNNQRLNPGNGWVSRLCHEPRVALMVMAAMLQQYRANGQLQVMLETIPISADVQGDAVRSVTVQSTRTDDQTTIQAKIFIDATDLGELFSLAKVEHVTGAEARSETEEPSAEDVAMPQVMQGFTYCFAIDYMADEEHVIDKPAEYEFWKQHVPEQPGFKKYGDSLLNWRLNGKMFGFTPNPLPDHSLKTPEGPNYWTYRRLIDRKLFKEGAFASDISLINWGQNDFFLGPIIGVSNEERKKNLYLAKQLSLSLLYWMQTEAPRLDGKLGYPGLRLRKDIVGTKDGMAKYPYVREGRRLKAQTRIVMQHVSPEWRKGNLKGDLAEQSEPYPDSVGIGHYLYMDLHARTGGKDGKEASCYPFRIPAGALIPQRMTNVLAGSKNLGTTQMTNGCYRLHTVEWAIGEAAGALAALSVSKGEPPEQVRQRHLADLQKSLADLGCPLDWPEKVRGQYQ